jgi:ATP-dependent exoDNAse (exonuclease V) beta subunit
MDHLEPGNGSVDTPYSVLGTLHSSPLTEQQSRAVCCREVSVVLSSGAGCGKTHVLTERYLFHLRDDGAEVGQTVAITFTDRAARQMRSRIRKAIVQHARDAGTVEEADRWARHLRGLETAQISTIHAFCGTLLRQHAVEAGLDPHFNVLEDVLSANLEAEALIGCLQRLLTAATGSGEDLRELVLLYGWNAAFQAIQSLMRAWDELPWKLWHQRSAEEIAAQWQDYARGTLLPRYVEYLNAACPKIARCLWLLRTVPPRPDSKMAANVRSLLEEMPRLAEAKDLTVAVERLIEAAKVGSERAKAWPSEEAYQTIKGAFEDFRAELKGQCLEWFATVPEGVSTAAAVGQRFLHVADEAVRAYHELKHHKSVVDFQDLLVLARNLLRDHTEVRERVQRRTRFLLIDELQDTDPVQMELVQYLCGAELTAGKLFTVGDHKQCLLPGTLIRTPTGDRRIEEIQTADRVVAAAGLGRTNIFSVTHVHQRPYSGYAVEIVTASGQRLCCTPEHALFTRLIPDLKAYYVYLMARKDKGYRVGITRGYRWEIQSPNHIVNGLSSRCHQEGGDAIWVLRRCQNGKEAQMCEQLYLAQFGLPGLCFNVGAYSELDQEAVDFVFASVPTKERARQLANEMGLNLNVPHYLPLGARGNVALTYFGGRGNSRHGTHRIHFESRDPKVAEALAVLGCRVAKPSTTYPRRWRVSTERADYGKAHELASQVADRIGAPLLERYALTQGKRWECTPAGQVVPGMEVPLIHGDRVVSDEVVRVARQQFEGMVYDLTVPHVHNYVAGGIVVHNSIYRFRGANVHLFRDLRQSVPHEGRLGLTVNFRSQPAILDFTNALLGHRLQDYEPLVPHHAQINPGPCVEFLWSPRGDKENVAEARTREADWIGRRIAAMVQGEELVVERSHGKETLRPVRLGDIVLLFRAMSNVHLYEAALRRYGLDYYLVGGRAFFAQQEIYDLLNLLRSLENPQDAVSLAGTLRSPFCCLSDEALFVLSRHSGGLWAGLHDGTTCARLPEDQRVHADRARRHLDHWRGLKDRLPIAHLLGEVFADSGYDAATQFEFLGDRKLANLWKLIDLARTFDRSGLFGLAEFIQRLGDLVRTQPREEQAATQPENADVVRLMTIHQAKGLEFPVVIIPDVATASGSSHHSVAHWDSQLGCVVRPPSDEDTPPFPDFGWKLWQAQEAIEEWHEDLRTLYVACTRAQDYLVLSACLKPPFSPTNTWMLTLAERFDLSTGRCLAADVPEDHLPKVRVLQSLETLPQPLLPKPGGELLLSSSLPGSEGPPPAVSPVPLSMAGKQLFTLAELERYLTRKSTGEDVAKVLLRSSDVAFQFDAEDGSDRTTWGRLRDNIEAFQDTETIRRDRLMRTVLERWDYRCPDAWRPLLAEAIQMEQDAGSSEQVRRELEPLFTQFAASETRQQLATARTVYREMEFVLDWSMPEKQGKRQKEKSANLLFTEGPALPLFSSGSLPSVRGVIDCLWQDAKGSWHLLAFTADRVLPAEQETYWQNRKPGLVLSAWAIQRQFGTWPKSVTLYFFNNTSATQCSGRHLQHRRILTAVAAALSEVARQPLSD